MAVMTDPTIQRLVDIEAIRQLKASYCRCVAIEDWRGFRDLFAPELQFIRPGGEVHDGRDVFMAYHEQTIQQGVWGVVHCYTSQIEITGPNSATGLWAMSDVHVWPGGDEGPTGHIGYGPITRTTSVWTTDGGFR